MWKASASGQPTDGKKRQRAERAFSNDRKLCQHADILTRVHVARKVVVQELGDGQAEHAEKGDYLGIGHHECVHVLHPRPHLRGAGEKPEARLRESDGGERLCPWKETRKEHVPIVLTARRLERYKVERREHGQRSDDGGHLGEAHLRRAQCGDQEVKIGEIAEGLPDLALRRPSWNQRARDTARHEQIVPRTEEVLDPESKWAASGIQSKHVTEHIVDDESLHVLLREERQILVHEVPLEDVPVDSKLERNVDKNHIRKRIKVTDNLKIPLFDALAEALSLVDIAPRRRLRR